MHVETGAEQLFFVTTLVRATFADGSKAVGTAFVYVLGTNEGNVHLLVTNKHVLRDATDVVLQFTRSRDGEPALGEAVHARFAPFNPATWFGHPAPTVDVGVMPLGPAINQLIAAGNEPFYRALPESFVPDDATLKELDALERVIFIGYPAGLYDSANLTPIARQGLTATPIALDYRGLPAFLIDAAVIAGSSGSPVFLFDRGMIVDRRGNVTIGSRTYLLGVLAAVHTDEVEAEVAEAADRLVARFRQAIGLGIVFKASTINECVDLVLAQHGLRRQPIEPAAPPLEGEPQLTPADQEIAETN